MRWRFSLFQVVLATCLPFSAPLALCQPQKALPAGKIDVRVLHAIHEPEESSVSYITIAVTVRSASTPFVIPNCPRSSDQKAFCVASLRRANGKAVRVRKGLAATLGVEDPSTWKPIQVPPNSNVDIEFSIDLGLLKVRPGEQVRLAFGVWPDEESMKDLKRVITLVTPVFRIPVKPE